MGSSPILPSGSSGGGRWNGGNGGGNHGGSESCGKSSTFAYFVVSFAVLGSIGSLYGKYFLAAANVRSSLSAYGCHDDNEGSWSVGVFYGDSPFTLKPLEAMNIWKDEVAAWPLANPVLTCASLSNAGFPSNFVADPFLYKQGNILYMFYETKNPITMQGDIGVSKSLDEGITWQQMGVALDEDWHLSYPYIFEYSGNIYMMPEGNQKGDLRLYQATDFPLKWTLYKIIMRKPLVDSFMISHDGKFWLFGSDHTGLGTNKNGQLEIWYSSSPFGPWKPHKKNPIYNTDRTIGARNGGRPFVYNGNIYRIGQDCGTTYGHKTRMFRIDVLTTKKFKEVEVPFSIEELSKGRNAWNGDRSHHIDVQQLTPGKWIAVIDGDRVPSGAIFRRFVTCTASVFAIIVLAALVGILLGAITCVVPLNWCPHNIEKRSDAILSGEQPNLSSEIRYFCSRLNRACLNLRSRIRPNTCSGSIILFVVIIIAVMLTCTAVKSIHGGSGADEPYPLHGYYSQFTLLTMTYDARLWNLKMYIKHYSRCSSVQEIVVVWNKGIPPQPSDFDSAVPVRIRVEEGNSLNNRFKADSLIKTRAVLELDDDIMMACSDIERGFRVWRQHPDRIVGFYPRLITRSLKYEGEKNARKHNRYNMILTGAAFLDSTVAFERYWNNALAPGRAVIDDYFNCEDILMNYLYANMTEGEKVAVEYVRPTWAIDTSKLSGVGISRNTNAHYGLRSKCLRKFEGMYGKLIGRNTKFNGRKDGWDL